MAANPIHALLGKNLGLHVASIGENSVDRAVGRRARALGLAGREAYLETLNTVPGELKELIEEVVIPETWFFRDTKPFTAMVEYALGPWSSQHRGQTMRLLSVPCSTGEEPYSMAMALLAAGWARNKFQIEAIDISRRSLDRAREGRYTENSFRGSSLAFRAQYFTLESGKYVISPLVRQKVRFHHGNLLDQSFMAAKGIFDIVFCRNVLIYLDENARKQTISTLSRMVASDGLLFAGHSEASFFLDSPFSPAPYRQSFAFVKAPPCPPAMPTATSPVCPPPQKPPAATQPCAEQEYLKQAQTAADRGALGEALALCQKQIHQHGPSAAAFFLLGVIQDAAGDENSAFASLRRAVYLEPEHEEALLRLALLAEKLGDSNTAKAYRQRVERCRHDKETG